MKNPGSCFEHQVILETVTNSLLWHTLQSVPKLTFSAPPREFFNSLLETKLKAEGPAPISSPSRKPSENADSPSPRHDRDFQFAKAGLLEPLMQLHLAEAEPLVGVKLARTLDAVAEQVQSPRSAERVDRERFSDRPPRTHALRYTRSQAGMRLDSAIDEKKLQS